MPPEQAVVRHVAAGADIWSDRFAASTRTLSSSAIRELLKVTEQPSIISFAGGLPAPECFPTDAITAATARVLAHRPIAALQYGPTEGFTPLRALLAARMTKLGLPVQAEQVLITTGSQQALDLFGKLLIDPGAPVAVELPTYLGALQAWRPYRPAFVTIPMDAGGLDVDALEAHLAQEVRPRFLYLVSCFQNPTGVTLAPQRRVRLLELAAQYGLPIIEDDPYGELSYDGPRPVPLAVLDVELHGTLRHVAYLSTFSKLLAPGMRIGWVAAPPAVLARLVQAKQGMDLHTSSFTQAVAEEACRDGLLERHIPTICATYCARRDAMLAALAEHMPPGVRWTSPGGGMFLWLTLPDELDTEVLLQQALQRGVAFVPGAPFYANGGGKNTLRLNFSHAAPEQIRTGIARLAQVIEEHRRLAG